MYEKRRSDAREEQKARFEKEQFQTEMNRLTTEHEELMADNEHK
jgi:hypothetical protein